MKYQNIEIENMTCLAQFFLIVYNKNWSDKYEILFYKYDDPIWAEIVTKLPKDNNGKEEEKLQLLNVTLYLLSKKQKYSLQLKWESLKDDDFKNNCLLHGKSYYTDMNVDSLSKKFDRWHNNGTWEKILPIFFSIW